MSNDVHKLIEQLAAQDATVRQQAAEKLATLEDAAAPAALALITCLQDTDETVREFANAALESLGPPEQQTVDQLEHLLSSPHADTAYWAATLLGRLENGAMSAVESLKTAAAEHPSPEVRKRATWALGKIANGS
jgi:HEAT repeat protein